MGYTWTVSQVASAGGPAFPINYSLCFQEPFGWSVFSYCIKARWGEKNEHWCHVSKYLIKYLFIFCFDVFFLYFMMSILPLFI